RDVALVPSNAVTGAHHPARQFAAGTVVVAHLGGALETATRARISRPAQLRLERLAVIVRRITEETTIVEFGCPHDLAGIEEPFGIKPVLDIFEGASEPRTEHRFVEFRTHEPIAVFAGMRALVFAHHRKRLFGDLAHGMYIFLLTQIQNRANMETARAGVRVPGPPRPVLLENPGEPRGVIGEMFKRNRAVFDEGYGFPLLFHRHHDVEARRAHLGNLRL